MNQKNLIMEKYDGKSATMQGKRYKAIQVEDEVYLVSTHAGLEPVKTTLSRLYRLVGQSENPELIEVEKVFSSQQVGELEKRFTKKLSFEEQVLENRPSNRLAERTPMRQNFGDEMSGYQEVAYRFLEEGN